MKTRGSERSVLPYRRCYSNGCERWATVEWVFPGLRQETPVDPKNAANRYVRPAAKELGYLARRLA